MKKSEKLSNPSLPKQKLALSIGNYGCYFSCLCRIAEKLTGKDIDILEAFGSCKNSGWINDDCYVKNPDKIIEFLSGKKASTVKTNNLNCALKENAFAVGCYKWNAHSHFVLLDKTKKVEYDPLGASNTVKNGRLDSLRVITIAG